MLKQLVHLVTTRLYPWPCLKALRTSGSI